MNILDSTTYVDLKTQKENWYQLSVINMWDWSTKPICYRQLDNVLIPYCLYKYSIQNESSCKQELISELNVEMENILKQKGYITNNEAK